MASREIRAGETTKSRAPRENVIPRSSIFGFSRGLSKRTCKNKRLASRVVNLFSFLFLSRENLTLAGERQRDSRVEAKRRKA